MGSLTLKKQSKQSIAVGNVFYGHELKLPIPSSDGLSIEVVPHQAQFGVKLKARIGGFSGEVYLETLPPLEQISKQFQGIDLFSLPLELQLTVLCEACRNLIGHFSQRLGASITIEQIEQCTVTKTDEGIDFIINHGEQCVTSGRFVFPKETLALLSKKIVTIPKLREFNSVDMSYRIRLGTTRLSQKEYSDMAEGDIIFFDEHELAKDQKVDIIGLGSVRIKGQVTPNGVIVRQIG